MKTCKNCGVFIPPTAIIEGKRRSITGRRYCLTCNPPGSGTYIRCPKRYSLDELKEAVSTSYTVAQALKKIGVTPYGGNYHSFYRSVKKFGLDISHFRGQGWKKGKRLSYKRPIEEYLSNKFRISSDSLRKRLFNEGLKETKCESCGLETWLNQPISLELDHIDGNKENNNLDNLKVLCPNCHAQTSTYRGKNIRKM